MRTSIFVVAGVLALASIPAHADERAEVERIRGHLWGAEALLSHRDVSSLTAKQRKARALNARRLADYRARGRFPHNNGLPGRVPIFRDADGTLCAVGYLIARSGRQDLVERIANRRNLATVGELVDEPGLAEWLVDNGLTLAEAARIQPGYQFIYRASRCVCGSGPPTGYTVAGGVVKVDAAKRRTEVRIDRIDGDVAKAKLTVGSTVLVTGAPGVGHSGGTPRLTVGDRVLMFRQGRPLPQPGGVDMPTFEAPVVKVVGTRVVCPTAFCVPASLAITDTAAGKLMLDAKCQSKLQAQDTRWNTIYCTGPGAGGDLGGGPSSVDGAVVGPALDAGSVNPPVATPGAPAPRPGCTIGGERRDVDPRLAALVAFVALGVTRRRRRRTQT